MAANKQSNPFRQEANSKAMMVKADGRFEVSNRSEHLTSRDHQSGSHDCQQDGIQKPSIPKTIHVKFAESSAPVTDIKCTDDQMGDTLLKSRERRKLMTSKKSSNASWECEPKQNDDKPGLRRNSGFRQVSDPIAPLHTAASIGKDILQYSFATCRYDDISEVTFRHTDQ
jgi:hypothetical protein